MRIERNSPEQGELEIEVRKDRVKFRGYGLTTILVVTALTSLIWAIVVLIIALKA